MSAYVNFCFTNNKLIAIAFYDGNPRIYRYGLIIIIVKLYFNMAFAFKMISLVNDVYWCIRLLRIFGLSSYRRR